ncbi:dysbindin isoform X2 [Salmo salar]|uniref:Dysbindin isoform X2 n=1 Tax=Salmo salar TaxID=8030 RepID=A0ABM3DRK2_SALSA|nr:dysbindin-like isoform X2 [Salmo salar]
MSFHLEQADKGEEINLTTQISVLIQVAEAETEHAQRVPGMDVAQQMKLRERQRFFEEVFQHDVDVYLSSAHLQIHDYKRPPIGSVSSMEVNVDMLEQMDLMDISDQEALDVFLGSGGDEGVLASPLPVVHGNNNNDKVINQGRSLLYTDGCDGKFRMSSTSSTNSQNTNEDRRDTQVVQSDDEDVHVDTVLLMGSPPGKDEEKDQSILSS